MAALRAGKEQMVVATALYGTPWVRRAGRSCGERKGDVELGHLKTCKQIGKKKPGEVRIHTEKKQVREGEGRGRRMYHDPPSQPQTPR